MTSIESELEKQGMLQTLRNLGYKPHGLCWYACGIREFISYPFYEGDDPEIMIRTVPGDPTTMIKVRCFEIQTAMELSCEPGVPELVASFLVAIAPLLIAWTSIQPQNFERRATDRPTEESRPVPPWGL